MAASRFAPAVRSATLLLLLLGVLPGGIARAQVPQARDTLLRRIPLGALKSRVPSRVPAAPADTPATPARVTVPDVTGLKVLDAISRLATIGLRVGSVDSVQSTAPVGSVVAQWPAAGTTLSVRVLRRFAARLSLAAESQTPAAPQAATVPDLAGLTLDEARALLEQARLRPGTVTEVAGEAAKGTVAGQSPAGGTSADPGTGVDIQLSTGPADVAVPDLVGKTVEEAQAALAGVPLRIVQVDSEATASGNGTVVRQDPAPGTRVPPGTGITLVRGVATSPAAAPVPVPPPATAPPANPPERPGSRWPWALILTVIVLVVAAGQGIRRWLNRPPAETRDRPIAPLPHPPIRRSDPPDVPASPTVELSTTWDFGTTSLEVDGPLAVGPSLQLVAHGNLQDRVVGLEHDQPLVAGGDHE